MMKDLIRANAGLLLAGVGTFVLMGAGQALFGPALPVYAREWGLGDAAAGGLISAFWIGCAVGVAGMYLWGAAATPRIP